MTENLYTVKHDAETQNYRWATSMLLSTPLKT